MPSLLEFYNLDASQRLLRLFLICDQCFWAASAISSRRHEPESCPSCNKLLSKIPLGETERFLFSYQKGRGVELSFMSGR